MGYDQTFKELLRAFFGDFLRLFFPEQARRLKLDDVSFLDKELFTDTLRGEERRLDLVAQVRTRGDEKELVLVHVEVESRSQRDFGARMHEYYMALRLRHRRPVFPVELVLTHARGALDRPVCRDLVLGEEVNLFRYWRVGLPRLEGRKYLESGNRLAPALASLMSPGTARRAEW